MAIENKNVNSEISSLQAKLKNSNTAYSQGAYTKSDVAADTKLRSLEKLKSTIASNKARENWYEEKPKTAPGTAPAKTDAGFMSNALDALQAPLRGIVGAAKYATGKSSGKNLLDAVDRNVFNEKDEFSGLLKQLNIPAPVAAPLGFALDLTLDPVNWLTLGGGVAVNAVGKAGKGAIASANMSSVVPKMAVGLKEAGMAGAKEAVKSSFWDTASAISKLIPGSSKYTPFNKWRSMAEAADIAHTPEARQITKDLLDAMAAGENGNDVLKNAITAYSGEGKIVGAATKALEQGKVGSMLKKADEFKAGVGQKAAASRDDFAKSIGMESGDELIYNIVSANANRVKWADVIRTELSNSSGGNKVLTMLDYDPRDWFRVAKLKDELWKGVGDVDEAKVLAHLPEDMQKAEALRKMKEIEEKAVAMIQKREGKADFHQALLDMAKDGEDITKNKVSDLTATKLAENAQRLYSEGVDADEIRRMYKNAIKGTTEGDFVDTAIANMRKNIKENWKVGQVEAGAKLIDAFDNIYKTGMGIFKSTKVGGKYLSPGAHVNAYVGNHVMAHMTGVDITRPSYWKALNEARKFYKGKNTAEYAARVLGGDIEDYAQKYPGIFSGSFGFTPSKIKLMRDIDEELAMRVKSGAMKAEDAAKAKAEQADFMKIMDQMTDDEARAAVAGTQHASGQAFAETVDAAKVNQGKVMPGNVLVKDAEKAELASRSGFDSMSYIGNELTDDAMSKLRNNMKIRAEQGSPFAKVADYVLNKGPQEYEMIDQSNRLGLFTHLAKNGLNESELQKISRMINLDPAVDLARGLENGKPVYKLAPDKANELVSIVYLNYAAMPAFVRMMRSAPIVGSPFFSFTYGMGSKAMQTALENPAAFNKVSNALNATETLMGGNSPTEKKALAENPIYSWYNKPGMISLGALPFFGGDAIFYNAANQIPYMSLNMMNPSERKYEDSWPGKIAAAIDKLPFFKTPEGAAFFDFVLQPMLLGIKNPQNQFGSQLYPKDATALDKTGYAARTVAEAFVPSSISIAEAVTPKIPENIIPLLPSYSSRAMENAKYGKNPVGVAGKEAVGERVARRVMSTGGISLNRINLDQQK